MNQREVTQTLSEEERKQFKIEIMMILEKKSTEDIETALHQMKLKRNVCFPRHTELK